MENNYQTSNTENAIVLENVQKIQNDFYTHFKKNNIFKKQQKIDCAKFISNNIDIEKMIQMTFFIIPNTNIIFFDYTVFKIYGNIDNYNTIIEHCLKITENCIQQYGNYEVDVNLSTFTISALERFKGIIELFSLKAIHLDLLTKFVIYNSPSFMNTALQFLNRNNFLNQGVLSKTVFYKKDESELLLKELFNKQTDK